MKEIRQQVNAKALKSIQGSTTYEGELRREASGSLL